MQHVRTLAEIPGGRGVGTPGYAAAVQYLLREADKIKLLASARSDLAVEVELQSVSGAMDMHFLKADLTNAYRNLSNVVLALVPAAAARLPALLLGAHFDTTLDTPGASDAAACVGVALEVARLYAADASRTLAAPMIVLLNGGEETFLQGAHGFRAQARWAPRVGAFINLESTGPGGPDFAFQAAGGWPLGAYARSAPHPRGTVVAQDFFRSGLLPADTDFRVFEASLLRGAHGGGKGEALGDAGRPLPGLDLATLLDASAYHTTRDAPERIRPGTLQAMGENVAAVSAEFCRVLSSPVAEAPLSAPGVYVDFLGLRLVTYSGATARALHTTPLGVALALLPRGRRDGKRLGALALSVMLYFSSVAHAVLWPALLGAALAAVTGRPMSWVGHDRAAYFIYAPAALAGMLAPYAVMPTPNPRVCQAREGVAGMALGAAAAAAALAAAGLHSAFVFALWAAVALASLLGSAKAIRGAALAWALACALPALLVVAPGTIALTLHVVQKAGFLGAFGPMVVDAAVGAAIGVGVASLGGLLVPWAACVLRRRLPWLVLGLLLLSVEVGVFHALRYRPYTAHAPKKLFLQRTLRHGEGAGLQASWDAASIDSVPAMAALPAELATRALPGAPDAWLALYPVSNVLQGVSWGASGRAAARWRGTALPALTLLRREAPPEASETGQPPERRTVVRLRLRLQLPDSGWFGALNFTGDIRDWSWTTHFRSGGWRQRERSWRVVRFAGDAGSERWDFWVDVAEAGGGLRVDVAAARGDLDRSAEFPALPDLRRAASQKAKNFSVCEFNIRGGGTAKSDSGGPLLEPFASKFVGVHFSMHYDLPGATMSLANTTVVIQNSVFSRLSFRGQAVLALANSDVTLFNTTFAYNNNSRAGAIYAFDNSNLTVLESKFVNNLGSDGGAITVWNSSLLVNGTTFTNNSAGGTGGALNVNAAANVTVMSSVFVGNEAQNGGGVCLQECVRSSFFDNAFTSNWADKAGGGIFQLKCSGDITDTYFRDNQALNGASVWQNDCKSVIHSGSRFDNNAATQGSAGIELNQCSLDIGFCTFARGRGDKGAAIYMQGTTGNVHDCEFDRNAALSGGAVFRGSSNGNVAGSVFRNNTARQYGGAIYDSHVQGDITGNMFADNACEGGKGATVFRTVSSGSLGTDQGLNADSDVVLDNPAGA
ncbi:hypothetical protein WJX81_004900 [Elliptochloris bilobata]|uniref:Peptidase M28 domain-containing protein n=1 Tax=Elliptochloris bilobata TaxID=381761 RepID=A0AAW1RZY1_9CHLO